MKGLIYFLATCLGVVVLVRCANADDLVVMYQGTQTYYAGTITHVETDGLSGEVIFQTTQPPMTNANDDPLPTVTGQWHVRVTPKLATQLGAGDEFIGTCYGTTAVQPNHGGRVALICTSIER